MGMFDSVIVACPKCGSPNECQSKSGDCNLDVYKLEDCPSDVLQDVNRHAPFTCKCGEIFRIDFKIVPASVLGAKAVPCSKDYES